MTSLEAVATYLPPTSVPIESMKDSLGLSDAQMKMYRRMHKLSHVRRVSGGGLADLMLASAEKLDGLRGREDMVRYLVAAQTVPASAPYPHNPLHAVRERLALAAANAFTVSQHACASSLLAIDLCGRLLAADGDPDALALIVTGERVFTPFLEMIPGTTINGEASAAILVRHGGDHDRMLGYATRMRGEFNGGRAMPEASAAEYRAAYNDTLAEVIRAALDQSGVSVDDLALLLPHNVNRVSWERVCRQVGLPVERVFLQNVPVTGHCFGADPFLNYKSASDLGLIASGQHYLLAAAGQGATFSAMVFVR